MAKAYTLAIYRVAPGKEERFVKAWGALAEIFSSLPSPPYWGTLIRSTQDRGLFYSFGPWESPESVAAMRASAEAAAAFGAIRNMCEEMSPGDYELVVHIPVRPDQS